MASVRYVPTSKLKVGDLVRPGHLGPEHPFTMLVRMKPAGQRWELTIMFHNSDLAEQNKWSDQEYWWVK